MLTDVGGEAVWMDLLEEHAGKCVITRSAGTSVKADSPSKDPNAVEILKQLERDLGDAMVAVDMDKLNQIYVGDFASVRSSGKMSTKESILDDMKSGNGKLESFELGPMDVQAVGDVAVVHGSVTEKRMRDGKEVSGQFVWMNLLENRAGKWVVVRSAVASAKS